jgi:hypothetical protein
MVAQIQVTTTTEIISSYYSDFDGITIDTILMTHPDGTTEIRYGWTELTENGGTVHFIRTEDGTVLNGNWATTKTNKWLVAYKSLRLVTTQTQTRPQPVQIPVIRSYAGKAFSSGRIKPNTPDFDITEAQMNKILSDARQSLGW